MSCTVNLVPLTHLRARARLRRRARWVGVCAVFFMALATGWGVQRIATSALRRLSYEVLAIDAQRTEVQLRLQAAAAERKRLLDRLQTLAAARCPQPWPQRLVDLTRAAPESVFLTSLSIGGPGHEPRLAREPPPAAGPEAGDTVGVQTVRLLGYALDHSALLQFVNTLQDLPGWKRVDLLRATQEPFRAGLAVTFEIECLTGGKQP